MGLQCIDHIATIDKGKGMIARKKVHSDEEFFQDHFAGFPVLPGVLMLEGLVQTAAWFVRDAEDFKRSQVFMTHCSQVKYSKLVRPVAELTYDVTLLSQTGSDYEFRGRVTKADATVAVARFRMHSGTISEEAPAFSHLETGLVEKNRKSFQALTN
jgi:3-hydroxyacyl-[acyl-carrier-protein] dehydratase